MALNTYHPSAHRRVSNVARTLQARFESIAAGIRGQFPGFIAVEASLHDVYSFKFSSPKLSIATVDLPPLSESFLPDSF